MKKSFSYVINVLLFSSVFSVSGMLKRSLDVGAAAGSPVRRLATSGPFGGSPFAPKKFNLAADGVERLLKTQFLSTESDIAVTVDVLRGGGVVALPTETVYGLAADARNVAAVSKIFQAKNRPPDRPLIVHVHSFKKVKEWAKDIPPEAEVLANAFWPGPLTLLLHKADDVDPIVTGGEPTIGLRMPNHPVFLRVLKDLNTGLAAPSANLYEHISPTTAEHVSADLNGRIDAIFDGGPCLRGVESTIVDLTREIPRILRPGPLTPEEIESKTGIKVEPYRAHKEKVAGNVENHYQPRTPTFLLSSREIRARLRDRAHVGKAFGLVVYSADFYVEGRSIEVWKLADNSKAYEEQIYAALRAADRCRFDEILIENPPSTSEWVAVWDRLSKAAHKTA